MAHFRPSGWIILFLIIGLVIFPYILFLSGKSPFESSAETVASPSTSLRVKAVKSYVEKLENEVGRLETHDSSADSTGAGASRMTQSTQANDSNSAVLNAVQTIDPDFSKWKSSLQEKLNCKAKRMAIFYYYHARKAAGTSIRDAMKLSARLSTIAYLETEGVVLDAAILDSPGMISVTSLRDPVSRVLSLYWYEHVGWYSGILKQPQRCKTLRAWVDAWKDGSPFKKNMLAKNPKNNYVEIENYYIKMLIGWDGKTPITRDHLENAKAILRKFDLVLISEWLGDETQIDAFNAVFKGRRQVSVGHKVVGDRKARERLTPILASDEVRECET